ncbi:MAG: STAS domain-containing protein [Acidimicrobiales bacterium]
MTTITVRTAPEISSQPTRGEQDLGVSASFDGACYVVRVTGDLDLGTRDLLFAACTVRHHRSVVVDLSGLAFMDCGGYGGIVAARNIVEADDRTLTLRGARGKPGRLLGLIAHLERRSPRGFELVHHVDGFIAPSMSNAAPA